MTGIRTIFASAGAALTLAPAKDDPNDRRGSQNSENGDDDDIGSIHMIQPLLNAAEHTNQVDDGGGDISDDALPDDHTCRPFSAKLPSDGGDCRDAGGIEQAEHQQRNRGKSREGAFDAAAVEDFQR